MTALRFQTGGGHQTSPASLWGGTVAARGCWCFEHPSKTFASVGWPQKSIARLERLHQLTESSSLVGWSKDWIKPIIWHSHYPLVDAKAPSPDALITHWLIQGLDKPHHLTKSFHPLADPAVRRTLSSDTTSLLTGWSKAWINLITWQNLFTNWLIWGLNKPKSRDQISSHIGRFKGWISHIIRQNPFTDWLIQCLAEPPITWHNLITDWLIQGLDQCHNFTNSSHWSKGFFMPISWSTIALVGGRYQRSADQSLSSDWLGWGWGWGTCMCLGHAWLDGGQKGEDCFTAGVFQWQGQQHRLGWLKRCNDVFCHNVRQGLGTRGNHDRVDWNT